MWIYYFCLNKYFRPWRTATPSFRLLRRVSCGRPPFKIFVSGGNGQPAAAGFQPAARPQNPPARREHCSRTSFALFILKQHEAGIYRPSVPFKSWENAAK
jgi:hypothetical protein